MSQVHCLWVEYLFHFQCNQRILALHWWADLPLTDQNYEILKYYLEHQQMIYQLVQALNLWLHFQQQIPLYN